MQKQKIILQILFLLCILKFNNTQDNISNDETINLASKQGYDITNPNDDFFYDICLSFSNDEKKDVSLEYRRKYYFYPNGIQQINDNSKRLENIFTKKYTNSYYDCFLNYKTKGINLSTIVLIPFFFIQILIVFIVISKKSLDLISNTPQKKLELLNKGKNIEKETNHKTNEAYTKFYSEENNTENKENKTVNKTEKQIENKLKDEVDNDPDILNKTGCFEKIDSNLDEEVNYNKKSINTQPNEEKAQEIFPKKGNDFISFNNQCINIIKQNEENVNESEAKINNFNNESVSNLNDNNFNNKVNLSKEQNLQYVREEYFYFTYSAALIKDNRSIFRIYKDLLEQCQIFYKFYSILNIYEDKKLFIVYYCLKWNLHFLFHLLFFRKKYIDKIFDNSLSIFNNIMRCFLSTIIITIFSVILYFCTNVKKLLIKNRYRVTNLRLTDPKMLNEIVSLSNKMIINFLYYKVAIFMVLSCIIFALCFYFYFCFCVAYRKTQFLLLKCVLLDISISQISPFILCWIPAFLRYKAIMNKNKKLYRFMQIIESFFVS